MVFCPPIIFAQTNVKNEVPPGVVAAFATKYPGAELKKWEITNNEYTAKAVEGRKKFYATFSKENNWVKTTSKISWSKNLPPLVNASLKKSLYASWKIDGIKKVETPDSVFYEVLVDNLYQQIDADHAGFAENLVLNFKPAGELFEKKAISSALLF